MPVQGWSQALAVQSADAAQYDTYTTAKTVIGQQGLLGIPGGTLRVGDSYSVKVRGAISNIVTTPGTITFQVMMGSIVIWSSGAIQLNATAHTLRPFALDIEMVVQLVNTTVGGAVAKIKGVGVLTGVMFTKTAAQVDGVNSETSIVVPVTTPAQGTAFDSTVSQILDFWAGWSISNAGNAIRIDMYRVTSNN